MRTCGIRSLHDIWSAIKASLNWTIIVVIYKDFADLNVKIITLIFAGFQIVTEIVFNVF